MPTEKVIDLAERRQRHGKNPFKKRELFIVGGQHCVPWEPPGRTKNFMDLQSALIGKIAARKKCTGYFEDGMSKADAFIFNGLLERLVVSDYNGRMDLLEKIQMGEKAADDYGSLVSLKMMYSLRMQGIPIQYLETEAEMDPLEVLHGKLPFSVFEQLVFASELMTDNLGPEEGADILCSMLHGNPLCWAILMNARDRSIFEKVSKNAKESNVMFIGRSHALDPFNENGQGFEVHRVDFKAGDGGNITVYGGMPSVFAEDFRTLAGIDASIRLEVEFR